MSFTTKKLGGILGQNIHLSEKTVTVTYGTKICTYNKQSKRIVYEIDQFENDIVNFRVSNDWIFAIDRKGVVKSFNFQPESQHE